MTSRRTRLAATLAGVAILATSCGNKVLTQNALDPRGPEARRLSHLINPVFLIAAIVFVFVEGLILVAVLKFRRRSDDEMPKQVHGNVKAELGWTIAPAVLLALIGVSMLGTIFRINRIPANAMVVNVTGHQWWWEYEYPGSHVTTANELHIPTGQSVTLYLRSVDVIHNFWPPKLSGKVYAIPGRTNHMQVEADTPGTYYGQCSEFCGLSHANMRLQVIAHTPDDFRRWVAANEIETPVASPPAADNPDAAAGETLFRGKGCAGCHSVTGVSAGTVGPNLTHFQQRKVFAGSIFDTNDLNLRLWLRDPPAEKPGSMMPNLHLSEDEITKLIAYLDTLK